MKRIIMLDNDELKPHEEVRRVKVEFLKEKILKDGKFISAILVDRKTKVILDGHHRSEVIRSLGCRKIPCVAVDYLGDVSIRVYPRREIKISKREILRRAAIGNLFPPKTTKHEVLESLPCVSIPLSSLK